MARRALLWVLMAAYLLFWVGGIISYVFLDALPAAADWAAPMFLTLAAAGVLASSPLRDWPFLWAAGVIGFASELSGLSIHIPYGPYHYTDTLQPQIAGSPLVMIAAWMVLIAYVRQHTVSWRIPFTAVAVLGALWMTAIDLVIDPLAAGPLNYWAWVHEGLYYGIPFTNFVGWFVVSLVIFLIWKPHPARNPWAVWIGWSVILFFTIIAFGYRYWIPGVIGLALIAIDISLLRQSPGEVPGREGRAGAASGAPTKQLQSVGASLAKPVRIAIAKITQGLEPRPSVRGGISSQLTL